MIYVLSALEQMSKINHLRSCQGDFQQYVDLFEKDLTLYGSYWHHLLGGWRIKDRSNVKFIWFEEMKVDQKKVIQELCDFLDHPLTEEKVIEY